MSELKINFLSRKFILSAVLFTISTILLIFVDKVSFSEWSRFCEFLFTAYVGTNVIEKFSKNRKGSINNEKS